MRALALSLSLATTGCIFSAPDGAEVCGAQMTADGRTLFVNIQHPGTEQPRDIAIDAMTWPDKVPVAQGGIVRSATVAITRIDGGVIGSRSPAVVRQSR